MGRPFSQEIKQISYTYNWAKAIEIEPVFLDLEEKNLWIIGSGGSTSACELLSLLQFKFSRIGFATTPLELQYRQNALDSNSNIAFISASGRNSDILFGFDTAINHEPANIFNICLKKKSLLSEKAAPFSIAKTIEFDIPTGKDGFLATNSLIAYFTLLPKLFGLTTNVSNLEPAPSFLSDLNEFANSLIEDFTITVLYGGWGKPVAIDIESKFSEAGLGNILLADYRNFGHGRHNWFDKKKRQSAIIAIVTPEEKEIAEKTLKLLPSSIPVQFLISEEYEHNASLELLIQAFWVVDRFGKKCGIDPGRPGVPDYGSKLYKLKYSKFYQTSLPKGVTQKEYLAVSRKTGNGNSISIDSFSTWIKYYSEYKRNLEKTQFNGLIMDYDGTLCSSDEKYKGPREEIKNWINNFLKNGIFIAFVTGRGKSIREVLQEFIPQLYWNKVVVGYYNGSQIGLLEDSSLPNAIPIDSHLITIEQLLLNEPLLKHKVELDSRLGQLTAKFISSENINSLKQLMIDLIRNSFPFKVQILESSHSIDIILIETTKSKVIEYCTKLLNGANQDLKFLSIGDRGKWPGNDYQLLSNHYSLSVDQVSSDPKSCWNFASKGIRRVEATLEYFNAMNINESFFKIKI
ncbi:MAG: hypothetical protein RI922_996 [Bacteroidota bacterium]|jgi:hydroxymethylpyrimidine pyrophosphatase-like HAD family hydrolase